MRVTHIQVNHGQRAREGGFKNPRLDGTLGVIDKGPGQRFAFAFQVAFELEGMTGDDVMLRRKVTHKTYYKQRPSPTPEEVIAIMRSRPLRRVDPTRSEDSPDEGNVKREASRVVVQDGPGPSFSIDSPKMYPMAFEGKFILMAQNTAGGLLASVEYYVCLLKRELGGRVEGHFEVLRQQIVPPPPPPPRDFTIKVWGSWPNDFLDLDYVVRSKQNVERQSHGRLSADGAALVRGFNPDYAEIRFPGQSSFWNSIRLGETYMLPGGRYTYVCR